MEDHPLQVRGASRVPPSTKENIALTMVNYDRTDPIDTYRVRRDSGFWPGDDQRLRVAPEWHRSRTIGSLDRQMSDNATTQEL
jgi:hypothetical protein